MSQSDFLRRLVAHLDRSSIAYMVAGSVASGYYGEPRSTQDIDVVIEGSDDQVRRFARSVAKECYVSDIAVEEAIRLRSQFNAIDYATGWKLQNWA